MTKSNPHHFDCRTYRSGTNDDPALMRRTSTALIFCVADLRGPGISR